MISIERYQRGDVDSAHKTAELVDTGIDGGTPWNPRSTDPGFELVKAIGYLLTNR